MYAYRITKYNPCFRDKSGVYLRNEWTEYSDIGKLFADGILTMEDYLMIEKRYISCILEIMKKSNVSQLRIVNLERRDTKIWKDNSMVSMELLPKLLRDCLRNRCWCRLVDERISVHFGYDYYMYVECGLNLESIKTICISLKLYCEALESSPYKQ